MVGRTSSEALPPGFRFHPTDEELITYYLQNQATSKPCPVSIIPEVDIYKFDPWELPEKAEFGDKEWYFFSPRDRKYRNGVRPNRAAVSGYWKATGTDKGIHSGSKHVGVKKALVFYKGKPPKGIKTDWIMHEYRLSNIESRPHPNNQNGSMRLDDWVLCRIYKKKNVMRSPEQRFEESSFAQIVNWNDAVYEQQGYKFPRAASLTHLWELDNMANISQLMDGNAYTLPFNNQEITISDKGDCKYQQGQEQMQNTDSIMFHQVNHHHHHQPFFVNPTV